jgi:hypothetical protein
MRTKDLPHVPGAYPARITKFIRGIFLVPAIPCDSHFPPSYLEIPTTGAAFNSSTAFALEWI